MTTVKPGIYTVTYERPYEKEREKEFENDFLNARLFAQGVLEDGGYASITDPDGEEVDIWN